MNLLLLDETEIDADGRAVLGDRRGAHLKKVLRAEPGQVLRGGIVRGPLARIEVIAVEAAAVRVGVTPEAATPPVPAIDLAVALPRPQALHRVLQFGAAMGVRHIDLTAAWRVEKSFFQSPSLRPPNLDRHLRLGAEQGMTTWVPSVAVHERFVPFLASLAERPAGLRLVAHPQGPPIERAWPAGLASGARAVLAIGPEGGWIDREMHSFEGAGFVPVGLGPWVLRVEAAVTAALAQIDLLRRAGAC